MLIFRNPNIHWFSNIFAILPRLEPWNLRLPLKGLQGGPLLAARGKNTQAVIVPQRLSGMLGGRPDVAEYFQNAYHDMQLGETKARCRVASAAAPRACARDMEWKRVSYVTIDFPDLWHGIIEWL